MKQLKEGRWVEAQPMKTPLGIRLKNLILRLIRGEQGDHANR